MKDVVIINTGDKVRLKKDADKYKIAEGFSFNMMGATFNKDFRSVVACEYRSDDGMTMVLEIPTSDFAKYFEKDVPEPTHPRPWSSWFTVSDLRNPDNTYMYRTDRKRVEVRMKGVLETASCHPDDKFNLTHGINLCLARIEDKLAKQKLDKCRTVYAGAKAEYIAAINAASEAEARLKTIQKAL